MLAIPALLIAAAVLIAIGCTRASEDVSPTPTSASFVAGVDGVSGEVVVTPTLGGDRYELELRGLPEGIYEAMLRGGTCESPAEPAEPLGSLFAGENGETGVAIFQGATGDAGPRAHIAVLDDSGLLVACAPVGGGAT